MCGRLLTGWRKADPKVRCVIVGGRLSTFWLKLLPKVRCVILGGRFSTGWLKNKLKARWVMFGGMFMIVCGPKKGCVIVCRNLLTFWAKLLLQIILLPLSCYNNKK